MEIKEDKSFGIIPIFRDTNGNFIFCLIKHAAGHWSFPKGHQEVGETEQKTAIRELKEETGIDAINLLNEPTFIEKYSFEKDNFIYSKSVKYFLCFVSSVVTMTPDNFKNEIPEMKWVTYEEAKKLITFPEAKVLLEQVLAYLNTPVVSIETKKIQNNFFNIKIFKVIMVLFFLLGLIICFWYVKKYNIFSLQQKNITNSKVINNLSDISGDKPVSLTDIHTDYTAPNGTSKEKANILIVPGHEPNFGGAIFRNVYERNLVAEVGQDLQQFLETNPRYNITTTRDSKSWNSIFSDYFKNNWNNIISWEKTSKQNESKIVSLGVSSVTTVTHNTAPINVATRLYGITKWANENNIDLMIHLHFNDYPGHSSNVAGKYSGLVIYTPALQYSNSSTTKDIADAIFRRLSLYNPKSNLPIESKGIIDDPELIAVGANNTSDAASVLIEYDYIYEPQYVNSNVRSLALNDLAYQTYLGLQDFFTTSNNITSTSSYDPSVLYTWNTPVIGTHSNAKDIYALQTALIMDNDFPPIGKSKNKCPHSGSYDLCTIAALKGFQNKYNIIGEGVSGNKTFSFLNNIYTENKK